MGVSNKIKLCRWGIKKKLYATFTLVIFFMSILNAGFVLNSSNYISKYDHILDNIMSANTINGILKEELDAQMNEIVVGKCTFEEGKQQDILERASNQLALLEENEQTEEIDVQVQIIRRTFKTLTDQVNKIGEQIQQNKTYEETMSTLDYITEITTIIDAEIQQLVYLQLKDGERVKANIHSKFMNSVLIGSIILGGLILLLLFSSWYISKTISDPIQNLYHNASSVAEGDLTVQEVHVRNKDELQLLAQAFNRMIMHLRNIISSVFRTSNLVYDSSNQLYQSIQSSQRAAEEVACATQKITEVIYHQNNELNRSVDKVDNMSRIFTNLLDESDEILSSANKSVQVAVEGSHYIEDFMLQLNSASKSIEQTANDIELFNKNIGEMSDFLKTIKEIAAQTNLLGINASIEAAKAGELGRGFSVVAQEVKKLAEESDRSAKRIEQKINLSQNQINRINQQIKQGVEEIFEGNKKAQKAKEFFYVIEITNKKVNKDIKDISEHLHKVDTNVESVKNMIGNVKELSAATTTEVETISGMGEEEAASMEQIVEATILLKEFVDEMNSVVNKFTI